MAKGRTSNSARNYLKKDIKKLFAFSGNQCAEPNCKSSMIAEDGHTVLGEICHISAASANGPRYREEMSDDERRSYENLILLCSDHHKQIDNPDNIANNSEEKLKNWKKQHENKFTNAPIDLKEEHLMKILELLAKKRNRLPKIIFTTLAIIALSVLTYSYWDVIILPEKIKGTIEYRYSENEFKPLKNAKITLMSKTGSMMQKYPVSSFSNGNWILFVKGKTCNDCYFSIVSNQCTTSEKIYLKDLKLDKQDKNYWSINLYVQCE